MIREGAAAAILSRDGRLLLIKEGYDRRRYGFPGGAVEPGETPNDAVVRETREETGVTVSIDHVIGVYRLDNGFAATLFRCSIVDGVPELPGSGEIAEVGWFEPASIPGPVTNLLYHALSDVLRGARDVVREELPRIN